MSDDVKTGSAKRRARRNNTTKRMREEGGEGYVESTCRPDKRVANLSNKIDRCLGSYVAKPFGNQTPWVAKARVGHSGAPGARPHRLHICTSGVE